MNEAPLVGQQHRSLDDTPVRVVSARPTLSTRLKTLWSRRELLIGLVWSDIRIKYKNSTLGIFWSMLSPAFTLGVYFLVFSVFLRNGIPNFVIYLFSGLVVWNMFQNSINTATGVIVDRAALVKKVSFPREILALSNVGAAVVYFVVQLVVLIIFVAALGHAPAWRFLLILPISFLSLYFFTSALAMVMSAINVYLRDMKHLMEVLLQLWFWLTPVVYSYENSIAPHLSRRGLTIIYFLNPITLIVVTFQRVFYVGTVVKSTVAPYAKINILPTWSFDRFLELNLALFAVTVVLFLIAEAIFGRLEGNFESEL
ncbi:MAG: Transport permease protein [Acidimicrobiaceae bacterium]|nr:Transport permease protein [Acidimicrobiaceae bacterium]